ncbi:MAG: 50S ribosomal protein L25 [Elusimicrobiota bacterium]|nr:50S ribosomal protein L25 [Elusimicrobiota bacterium]
MELQVVMNKRETGKKSLLKQLRKDKKTPAIIYGAGFKAEAVWVDEKEISGIIKNSKTSVLSLNEGKKQITAVIKDVSYDVLSDRVNHVDFLKIEAKKELEINVPVELEGECKGVKEGGVLDFVTRELDIKTIPSKIPHSIKVDVSEMLMGDTLRVSELQIPEGVNVVTPGDSICVSIQVPRKEEEPAEAEAEIEAGAEAAGAEPTEEGKGAPESPKAEDKKPADKK